ncbi:MAG: hypothetical protein A2X94_01900 [Bdellovibrionales bacterium GWB1_55_8]|nr:MAG: hypothetical protein A2X94_01900 [Bdellovibrionales bacterium GWB1_55_8]
MIFPIDALLTSQRELGLIMAVLIGFGFGFVLERAGFGRAKKLAAQFYLYDMTVFKVMFTAIVTAMLGVIVLSGFGIADLKAISDYATSTTLLWPMLVGGLLLGAGFIIAGYCPGTSIVASASGNLDGVVAFAGVVLGTVLYSEGLDAFTSLSTFHNSSNFGHVYLYDLLGVPAPLLALAVTLMAAGCFMGAEKVEQLFRAKLHGSSDGIVDTRSNPVLSGARRLAFGSFAGLAALGLGSLLMTQTPVSAAAAGSVTATEVARKVLEQPWDLRIIDLRALEACTRVRIPGSECVPMEKLGELDLQNAPGTQLLVLVGESDLTEVPPAARDYPGRIKLLSGGFSNWKSFALSAPIFPGNGASEAEIEEFRFRSTLHATLTGMKQAPPPPPAPSSGGGFKKKSGGGGCSG